MQEIRKQFRIAAAKQLLVSSVILVIQIIVFFVSAGNVSELRPWLYFGIAFVHNSVSIGVQYKVNPQLVVQRLKTRRKGSKLWDEVLMRVSNLSVIILIPVVAGLDIGRFQLLSLDVCFAVIGILFVILSSFLLNWAMAVNPHFEPTVRIQEHHKVIARGPYSIVRHPGYLSGILFAFSIPLIIGSVLTFIPVAIYWVLMIIRTWLEDKTLQRDLEGYLEYAKQTRFRLFPGIW